MANVNTFKNIHLDLQEIRDYFYAKDNRLVNYALAIGITLVALVITDGYRDMEGNYRYIFFLGGVFLTGYICGLWPALFATLLSAAMVMYFFIDPTHSLALVETRETMSLSAFLAISAAVSYLNHRRRKKQMELSVQHQWFYVTLSGISDGFIATDSKEKVVFMNEAAEKMTQWALVEAKGRDISEVATIKNERTNRIITTRLAEKILMKGGAYGTLGNLKLLGREGGQQVVEVSASPIKMPTGKEFGTAVILRDLSARYHAQEVAAKLAAIVESSGDAITGKDLKGKITSWNEGAEELYGYTKQEAVGKLVTMLMPPDHLSDFPKIMGQLRRGRKVLNYETVRKRKDGSLVNVALTISPIKDMNGRVVGASTIARDITENKKTEETVAALMMQLKDQNDRMGTLMDQIPAVVWEAWGKPDESKQRINFVSSYVEKLLGYTTQEWLSTPNFWLKIVHPEDVKRAAQESANIFASKMFGQSQFRWIAKNGDVIWVDAHSVVIKDKTGNPVGMRGVNIDITERKKREMLQSYLAESSTVLSVSTDPTKSLHNICRLAVPKIVDMCTVHIKNGEQVNLEAVALANQAKVILVENLEKEFPFSMSSRARLVNVIRTGQPEFYPNVTMEMLDSQNRDHQELGILKRIMILSTIIVPIKAGGEVIGAISYITTEDSRRRLSAFDYSYLKELADRLSISYENQRLYKDLQNALNTKDEFISVASHELKTPLTSISAFIQILLKQGDTIDRQQIMNLLKRTNDQVGKLNGLVAELLDVTRLEAGKLVFHPQEQRLEEVIRQGVADVAAIAPSEKIEIKGKIGGLVYCDKERIEQVLTNYLTNAIKYAPNSNKIIVNMDKVDGKAIVSVQDFGIGIAAEHQQKVFSKFFQVRNGKDTMTSLGLGLYISAEIIKRHGGDVWVESELGKGSTFYFTLPIVESSRKLLAA